MFKSLLSAATLGVCLSANTEEAHTSAIRSKAVHGFINKLESKRAAGVQAREHITIHPDTLKEMKFDEETDTMSLRGDRALKNRDNFFTHQSYNDASCTELSNLYGALVNYCFNWGENGIFMYKVNNKDKTFVQLDYDNENCNGVPIRVTDVIKSYIPDFEGREYGECFWDTDQGTWATVNYLSTYPDVSNGASRSYYETEKQCQNKRFREIDYYPENVCEAYYGDGYKYTCDANGAGFTETYWDGDTTCSGDDDGSYFESGLCEYDEYYMEYASYTCL